MPKTCEHGNLIECDKCEIERLRESHGKYEERLKELEEMLQDFIDAETDYGTLSVLCERATKLLKSKEWAKGRVIHHSPGMISVAPPQTTFSDFVEKHLGKELTFDQRLVCEKFHVWKLKKQTGKRVKSGLSIIPGGKAEHKLNELWEHYQNAK